jgi:hypothetical protein
MVCNSDEPSPSLSVCYSTNWEIRYLSFYPVASCGNHGTHPCCKLNSYKTHSEWCGIIRRNCHNSNNEPAD